MSQQKIKPVGVAPTEKKELAPFMGSVATRLDSNKNFGPQALEILKKKFGYLGNKLNLSTTTHHEHPYSHFVRAHCDDIVVSGMATNELILSVGAENSNQFQKRYYKGKSEERWKTTHGMTPQIGGLDELRHMDWIHALRRQNQIMTDIDSTHYHETAHNVCKWPASATGLCDCTNKEGKLWKDVAVFKSRDSLYYSGVKDGIHAEMSRRVRAGGYPVAYAFFNDYAEAVEKGIKQYFTPDDEGFVEITETETGVYRVKSSVEGNPRPYEHNIISTSGNSWAYYEKEGDYNPSNEVTDGVSFVYEVIYSFPMNHHRDVLCKIYAIAGPRLSGIKYMKRFFLQNEKDGETLYEIFQTSKQLLKDCKANFISSYHNFQSIYKNRIACEAVQRIADWIMDHNTDTLGYVHPSKVFYDAPKNLLQVTVLVPQNGILNEYNCVVIPELVVQIYNQFLARPEITTFGQEYRKFMLSKGYYEKLDHRVTTNTLGDTATLAQLMATRQTIRHMNMVANDDSRTLKTLLQTGVQVSANHQESLKKKAAHLMMITRKELSKSWWIIVLAFLAYQIIAYIIGTPNLMLSAIHVQAGLTRIKEFSGIGPRTFYTFKGLDYPMLSWPYMQAWIKDAELGFLNPISWIYTAFVAWKTTEFSGRPVETLTGEWWFRMQPYMKYLTAFERWMWRDIIGWCIVFLCWFRLFTRRQWRYVVILIANSFLYWYIAHEMDLLNFMLRMIGGLGLPIQEVQAGRGLKTSDLSYCGAMTTAAIVTTLASIRRRGPSKATYYNRNAERKERVQTPSARRKETKRMFSLGFCKW